ncbi:MAG TPA: DUF4956 domain-containing protein [Clostridiales bacterium]|nr:DUF4956 domain-containing protein [Clostridiales bacterium]
MSFVDMIKEKVLEQFSTGISFKDMMYSLILAFVLGLFIILVYRKTFRGVLFSKGFAFSLVLLAMVTAIVIRTISSNLALSLGMVGALSIVRFRTAIKDPVDTVFMFWAIAVGIMAGAGLYLISVIASLLVGIFYIIITITYKKASLPYLLIIRHDPEVINDIKAFLSRFRKYKIKSKTVNRNGSEITVELAFKGEEADLIDELLGINGVKDASLISYEGEFGL